MKKTKSNEAYTAFAKSIFENQIKSSFVFNFGTNIWRATWALDSLIDYFNTIDKTESSEFVKMILEKSMSANNGDWWDDYGWNGIVSLRAAELIDLDPTSKDSFIKNGINCWCYMNGPGWNHSTSDIKMPFVPYPEICDWQALIDKKNGVNIGAQNVYQYWETNKSPSYWKSLEPRYSPGGLWNTTSNNNSPVSKMQTCGAVPELEGLQNTVTNGLFMVLSLRLYHLSKNPEYHHYFTDRFVDQDVIYDSWHNQLSWFDNWFTQEQQDSSLRYSVFLNESILIRERVPQMKNNDWSPGYCHSLAWLGDQGLLLGAYREASLFISDPIMKKFTTDTYNGIFNGVSRTCWSNAGYTGISAAVLRPWVQYEASNQQTVFSSFPAGDDADYDTGIAVFCRYLQQAIDADFIPSKELKNDFLALADAICNNDFNNLENIECDGLIQDQSNFANSMTCWINQIAVLCIAIKMNN